MEAVRPEVSMATTSGVAAGTEKTCFTGTCSDQFTAYIL